jgi:hypothetical protein
MNLHRFQHRQWTGAITGAIPGVLLLLSLACASTRSASAAAIPAPALNTQQAGTAIVFYTQSRVSEDLWPALFQVLRDDLADGDGELPNGLALDRDPIVARGTDDLRGVTFAHVISVKLLGHCDVLPQTDHPSRTGPLGWVVRSSGQIQPFVSIDCARLAQVLRAPAAGLDKQGRRYLMMQAIAHVLIHEWSHIATQSSAHSARGITQAHLSVDELVAHHQNKYLSAAKR